MEGKSPGDVILGFFQEQRHRLLAALEELKGDEELEVLFKETLADLNRCEAEALELLNRKPSWVSRRTAS